MMELKLVFFISMAYLCIWIESGSLLFEYAFEKGRIEFERLEAVDEDKSIYKEN